MRGIAQEVAADPVEVLAALRRTRPRRLELWTGSPESFSVRFTSAHGTGVELSLAARVLRVPGGSRVSVTAPGQPNASLAQHAAAQWLDALVIEIEAAELDADRSAQDCLTVMDPA